MKIQSSQIVLIVLELCIFLIGLYLAFFKSYFQEKGKSIALKEDIEEITEKIETIKSQIYFSTESKLSLIAEERNALVHFHERYHLWLKMITDINLFNSNINDTEHIDKFRSKIYGAQFNCDLAQGRMEVFVNNDNINELVGNLTLNTLKLQHFIDTILLDLEQLLNEPISGQQGEKQKKFFGKKGEILKNYRKGVMERYKEIVISHKDFQLTVYNHLQNLLEK